MALPLKNKTKLTVSTFCHVFRQNWVGFFVKWKGVYCVHLAYVLLKCWTLDFLGGVATIFVNRVDLGCYLLLDKAFNRVPSKGLAKRNPSCSPVRLFARFSGPSVPPVQSWCAMGGVGACPFVSGLFVQGVVQCKAWVGVWSCVEGWNNSTLLCTTFASMFLLFFDFYFL